MNSSIPEFSTPVSSDVLSNVFFEMKRHSVDIKKTAARERIAKLKKLKEVLLKHQDSVREAMQFSFKKPFLESDISEILPVTSHINLVVKHLSSWMRTERKSTPLELLGASSYVLQEPKGVVLILSPWNYAVNLALDPLVSAVAAGNCVILKPSEATPAAVKVIKAIVAEVFTPNEVYVAEGGADVSSYLTSLPFDHIFFTGSPTVGKLVMKAAAENLSSVTLELGGKSPAIVHEDANIQKAANSLVFAKFLNTGQTCIAPDYLLVHTKVKDQLINAMTERIKLSYGEGNNAVIASPDYGRIVNEKGFLRISEWLEQAVAEGANILTGGHIRREDNYIEPTIIANVSPDSALMQHEIFGPVLPVIEYSSLGEAYKVIGSLPKPLASYIFSKSTGIQNEILKNTTSGGTTINDCLLHNFNASLPFGGVNNSGMGKGRGYYGFCEFSNARGVLNGKSFVRMPDLLSAPYTKFKYKIADILLRWF